mmetsp:Transcript_26797/g.25832  ORF Transcript_26797/g.25832 Transcript_26797/m.25832 type:complete len:208 (-) Transcript_26797:1153-1776(-)
MLLTEDLMDFIPVFLLNLHVVVGSSGTLHVEGNIALGGLALHAGAVLLHADDAGELEALVLDLVHLHWRLRGHMESRNPRGTADMHPFIKGLGVEGEGRLQDELVLGEEEAVVGGDLGHLLLGLELQFHHLLGSRLLHLVILKVDFFLQNHPKTKALVFSECELVLVLGALAVIVRKVAAHLLVDRLVVLVVVLVRLIIKLFTLLLG